MDYHFGEAARRAYVDREIERVDGWLEVGDKILIASLCAPGSPRTVAE